MLSGRAVPPALAVPLPTTVWRVSGSRLQAGRVRAASSRRPRARLLACTLSCHRPPAPSWPPTPGGPAGRTRRMRIGELLTVPWFLPGVGVSVAIGLLLGKPIGRALGVGRNAAAALVLSTGIILSATLTPLRWAIDFGATGSGVCDLSRLSLAPLGAAPLVPRGGPECPDVHASRGGRSVCFRGLVEGGVAAAAIALPFVDRDRSSCSCRCSTGRARARMSSTTSPGSSSGWPAERWPGDCWPMRGGRTGSPRALPSPGGARAPWAVGAGPCIRGPGGRLAGDRRPRDPAPGGRVAGGPVIRAPRGRGRVAGWLGGRCPGSVRIGVRVRVASAIPRAGRSLHGR